MGSTPRLKKSNDFAPYSSSEERIFALLPLNGKSIDTSELTRRFYRGKRIPMNGRVIVTGTLRKLIEKARANKEPFKIVRTPRAGPRPIEVWIEH